MSASFPNCFLVPRLAPVVSAATLLLTGFSALGASNDWTGDVSNNWENANNWTSGLPVASDSVYFKKSALTGDKETTISLGGSNQSVTQIRFYGNENFQINGGGNVLSVDAGGILNDDSAEPVPSTVTNVINADYRATANQTVDARDAGLSFLQDISITTSSITFHADTTGVITQSGGVMKGGGAVGQKLTKTGDGLLRLLGTNTFDSDLVIQAGTVEIGADAALGAAPAAVDANRITFNSGASLTATLKTTATFTLDAERGITLQSGAANIDTAAGTVLTAPGVITGSGSLEKENTGTLVLKGVNNYTGATTVNAGTLHAGVAGTGTTGTGLVTIKSGATLLGTGQVSGSFTANSGAAVQAGDGTGTGDFGTLVYAFSAGAFNFQTGSQTTLGLNPGGTGDLLSFNGGSSGSLAFNGNLTITAPGFFPTAPATFNLLDWTGPMTTSFDNRFKASSYAGLLAGNGDDNLGFNLPDVSSSSYRWNISQFTTNGTISLVAVPESSTAALCLLGLVPAFTRRRRRSLP